jgi:enoyl-CoA hydratase/carnithine racemase
MDTGSPRLEPLSPAQLRTLAGDVPPAGLSALGGQPFLLFLADASGIPTRDRERIDAWLRQLSCPVIGVAAPGGDLAWAECCDVLLEKAQDAAPLVAGIRQSPIAASIAVQLLRATPRMSLQDALTMESLAYAALQAGPEYRRWLDNRDRPAAAGPADEGPPVLVSREADQLAIELNRPARHNAISVEMRDALVEAFRLVIADDSILSVRVSAHGRCFSIGGDLDEFGTVPDPATGHVVRSLTLPARYLGECAERVDFHLHGACIGAGVELPAFARRVTAAPDSFFQLPELRFGLIPGAGGCVSLPRRIGRQRAAWLILSGKRINARQALDWRLVDAVTG